jgi:DNA-binding SARP family transcriptional activator
VLAPVEVVVNGVAARIGSPTQRTLLALHLMRPNELVSTDRIVDVLWADAIAASGDSGLAGWRIV